MQIRYSLTRLDLLRVNVRSALHNRTIILIWIGISLFFSLNAFNSSTNPAHGFGVSIVSVLIIALAIFTLMAGATLLLTLLVVASREHTGVLGEHTLRVTDEGLVEKTEHNESLHRWSAYHRTVKSGAYLFLYVTEGMAHVVPLRRPLLEGDLAAFEAALRAHTAK
jgi:hypothetical protein